MLITYCSVHVYGNHHKTLPSTTNIAAVVGESLEIETKVHPYTKLAVNISPKLYNQNKRICSHERRSVVNATSRVRREKEDVTNSPTQVRTTMTVKATMTKKIQVDDDAKLLLFLVSSIDHRLDQSICRYNIVLIGVNGSFVTFE